MKKLILILAMLALHSATHATTLPVSVDANPIDPDLLAPLVGNHYAPDAFGLGLDLGLDPDEPLPGIPAAAASSTHQPSQKSLSVTPAQQRGKRVALPLGMLLTDPVRAEVSPPANKRRKTRAKPVDPVITQPSKEFDENPIINKRIFKCKYCKYKTTQKPKLNQHLKFHEENVVSAKCSKCLGIFSIEHSAYKRHAINCHPDESITWTFWQNNEELSPRDAAPLLTTTEYTCLTCKHECPNKNALKYHLKLHEENVVSAKCSICFGIFNITSGSYKRHAINCHPDESITWTFWKNNEEISREDFVLDPTVYSCPFCKQECPHKNALEAHLKLHEENAVSAKCSECSGFFTIENNGYKKHATQGHPGKSVSWTFWQNNEELSPRDVALLFAERKTTCPICKQECPHKNALESHLKLHEENVISAKCSKCSGFFSIENSGYKKHTTQGHPGKSVSWTFWQNNKELSPKDVALLFAERKTTCPICKQECSDKNALEAHLKLHEENVVSAKCSECSGFFSIEHNGYNHHVYKSHPGKSVSWTFWQNNEELSAEDVALLFAAKKSTCHYCKQECPNKNALEIHLKLHEENVVSAKCSECSGFFSITSGGYKKHAIKCHPGKSITWTFWQNGEQIPSEK